MIYVDTAAGKAIFAKRNLYFQKTKQCILSIAILEDTKECIFKILKSSFPLDPLVEDLSWDALADSIGGGLSLNKSHEILIAIFGPPIQKEDSSLKTLMEIFSEIQKYQSHPKLELFFINT